MGRVSKEQSLKNHELILDAACRLFREKGVEAVSIADIMKAEGLTVGGFYKHFDSKEALVAEAFKHVFEQASSKWEKISVSRDKEGKDSLSGIVEHYFKKRPMEQTCPMLSFVSEASKPKVLSTSQDIYTQGVVDLFGQFKNEASNNSKLKSLDDNEAEKKIKILFSAMVGAGMLKRAFGDSSWIADIEAAILSEVID